MEQRPFFWSCVSCFYESFGFVKDAWGFSRLQTRSPTARASAALDPVRAIGP